MTTATDAPPLLIRSVQYRDLEGIARLAATTETETGTSDLLLSEQLERARSWYGLLKFLSYFPNPFQHFFSGFVAEQDNLNHLRGFVQIAPFNKSRSTWRVERVLVEQSAIQPELVTDPKGIGSQLLRYCFQTIWEARTWLLEVNIQDKNVLALYRQN
jgi:hypothetical protein